MAQPEIRVTYFAALSGGSWAAAVNSPASGRVIWPPSACCSREGRRSFFGERVSPSHLQTDFAMASARGARFFVIDGMMRIN